MFGGGGQGATKGRTVTKMPGCADSALNFTRKWLELALWNGSVDLTNTTISGVSYKGAGTIDSCL